MTYREGQSCRFAVVLTAAASEGVPLTVNNLVVLPTEDGASGDTIVVERAGLLRYDDAPKNSGETWAVGQNLYWDVSEAEWTTTSTNNQFGGYAAAVAASTATVGSVLMGR